ncbi:unnamed protein product, partial [Ectocarpus sp. 13 AM-2016]
SGIERLLEFEVDGNPQGKVLLEFEVDGNPQGNFMQTWVGYLRKVCDGFVESAEHPESLETLEFWDRILTHEPQGSGVSYITGWVSAFTCFDSDGNFLGKRAKFMSRDENWNIVEKDWDFPMIPGNSEICHNVVSCHVKIIDTTVGREYDGTLFAGQTVCEAERPGETGHQTVRPRSDWFMTVAVKE